MLNQAENGGHIQSAAPSPSLWRTLGLGTILVLAVFLAYLPAVNGGFLGDDSVDVTDNAALRSWDGLDQIWDQPGVTPQYYPLSFVSFWLNYQFGGLDPLGYHLVNLALHAIAALLLWRVLRILKIPGAWLAAGFFALHPVQVESVAYVDERKNVLSGMFFFGALLAAIKFWLPATESDPGPGWADDRHQSPHRAKPIVDWLLIVRSTCPTAIVRFCERYHESKFRVWFQSWKYYGFTIVLYLCALLSKTSVLPLPAIILLAIWWRRRPTLRDVYLLLPLAVAGLAMGLVTMHLENHIIATVTPWKLTWLQRGLLAGRDVWFYLGKLAWPHPLIFTYPHWTIRTSDWIAYVPVTALGLVLGILCWKRTACARHGLFALAYFVAMLFLTLGFIDIGYFRYAFVADHFQYLACAGPLTLAAAVLASGTRRWQTIKLVSYLRSWGALALLLLLGVLTRQQSAAYANAETLWRTTLARNPDCALAAADLGASEFQEHHQVDDAMKLDRRAIQLDPNFYEAWNNLGICAADRGSNDLAISCFRQALKINPGYQNSSVVLAALFSQSNNYAGAIAVYQDALKHDPDLVWALDDLAWILATCPDAKYRDGQQAVKLADHAFQLTHFEDPMPVHTLSAAYAETGDYKEAIRFANRAEELSSEQGLKDVALKDLKMISLFQAGQPYHEPAEETLKKDN